MVMKWNRIFAMTPLYRVNPGRCSSKECSVEYRTGRDHDVVCVSGTGDVVLHQATDVVFGPCSSYRALLYGCTLTPIALSTLPFLRHTRIRNNYLIDEG